MREGDVSRTAMIVCAARAIISARPTIRDFEDPFAERLLPHAFRRLPIRIVRRFSRLGAHIIALRMVAIDAAIRGADTCEQVVILGAGLDARAWRMPELSDIPVFEVDHPDTQRYKQRRAASFGDLPQHTYVAVDFTKDSLDERLESAGHRRNVPTIWIWEGVTMYLTLGAIEETLSVLEQRSVPGSTLITSYLPPGRFRDLVGFATSLVGERLEATFTPAAMAALMRQHGFDVVSDESAVEWHARWALPGAPLIPGFGRTERLVTATRAPD